MFVVPINNAQKVEKMKFHIDAPMFKYSQSTPNSCCFSSLASYFYSTDKIRDDNYIPNNI